MTAPSDSLMSPPSPAGLVQRAKSAFPDLSANEAFLLTRVEGGQVARFSMPKAAAYAPGSTIDAGQQTLAKTEGDTGDQTPPVRADKPSVRGKVIRWLLRDVVGNEAVQRAFGLTIRGARVEGPLEIRDSICSFPLRLVECEIPAGISLSRSEFSSVYVRGCRLGGFDASELALRGSFMLNDSEVSGNIILTGARIGGDLDLSDSSLTAEGNDVVSADGIVVGRNVFIRRTRCQKGGIRLPGCEINGDCDAEDSTIESETGYALALWNSRIRGSLGLRGLTTHGGTVHAAGIRIDGNLDLSRASLFTSTGFALDLCRASIGGSGLANNGFEIKNGGLALSGATIGRSLTIEGKLSNTSGWAFAGARLRVGHSLTFARTRLEGGMSLWLASIEGDLRFKSCSVIRREGRSIALVAKRAVVGGAFEIHKETEFVGRVSIVGMSIGGDLSISKSSLQAMGKHDVALMAARIRVRGSWLCGDSTSVTGTIFANHSRTDGELICVGLQFLPGRPSGLSAIQMQVDGALHWRKVGIQPDTRLLLNHASVNVLIDDAESWPLSGNLRLNGLTYRAIGATSMQLSRIEWIRRQGVFRPQPYWQLAKVLRDHGFDSTAREVAMAAEDERYTAGGLDLPARIWNRLLRYTTGYGYLPRRALYCLALLVTIGSLSFHESNNGGVMKPADRLVAEELSRTGSLPTGFPAFNALVYSIDNALPVVQLGQKQRWYPDEQVRCNIGRLRDFSCGKFAQTYLWFHVALGWALATLGIAGISGVIRRS